MPDLGPPLYSPDDDRSLASSSPKRLLAWSIGSPTVLASLPKYNWFYFGACFMRRPSWKKYRDWKSSTIVCSSSNRQLSMSFPFSTVRNDCMNIAAYPSIQSRTLQIQLYRIPYQRSAPWESPISPDAPSVKDLCSLVTCSLYLPLSNLVFRELHYSPFLSLIINIINNYIIYIHINIFEIFF